MGRLLGIDYGTKRIGLAVTDPLNIFASPLATVPNHEFEEYLSGYLKEQSIDAFVVGYPVKMNNQPGDTVRYVDPFIRRLGKLYPGIPVHRVDERLTSRMAFQAMIGGGLKKKDRMNKGIIDKLSAAIILQSFLEKKIKVKGDEL
ncbi:MAG TPA: Holliday junction resolvase RuvX [Bacteroidales bacterium]|nr:Holliday junction resolvase RuvX [Bacteroidales bacterium]HNR41424.1 Holliday junction resolvase RuvX [Bacteroidales bacterium]HPM18931.1 Holliday junction resolvase RuvX [Bacteroidales bacterium]HQG76820.1 Holliday junction resolvase RuvX [Bacteroidales bacterium]